MAETFCGDVSFILLCGFQREVLVYGQYLSNSHVNTSCFQVAGAHLPVLLRAGLYHGVSGEESWERRLQAVRQAFSLRTWEDPRDRMVQQAAETRHYHDVTAVHKHSCGGFISFEATQEKDGRLSEAARKISKTIHSSKFLLLTMAGKVTANCTFF